MNMKRLAAFSAILVLVLCASTASTAAAQTRPQSSAHFANPILNEIVRMSNAGMRSDTIIAYVKARQSRLEALNADDLIELRRAGVEEPVIQYLASVGYFDDRGGGASGPQMRYDSGEGGDGETVAVDGQPRSYGGWGWGWGYPYWGWGWGWGWPYGSVAFSTGHFHGGHGGFHGGHGGHGGGHGGHR